jgi:mannose/fructose/N-acetylgalactosamine-specific phosphotransferase system component IIC
LLACQLVRRYSVGKLDDMAAGAVAGVGLTMMWAGWTYGTGPKPPEAIAAATHISAAGALHSFINLL